MKKEYLYVIIYNIINIICWFTLAILFSKWWIMLFAWITSLQLKHGDRKYSRTCDKCGKRSPYADNPTDALKKAVEAGWHHYPDDIDYCPECCKNFTMDRD